MKILHLIDERWDSGVTAYALEIAELLQKDSHHVIVGVRAGKKPERFAKDLGLRTAVVENFFDLVGLLRRESFDVINVHTGRTHTWAVIAKMLMPGLMSVVAIVRTRGDARPVNVNFLTRFIYSRTETFIAASQHISDQFESELGLGEDQLKTIYPFVDAAPLIDTALTKAVGILGRIDPVKGHSTFLEAAAGVLKEMPDVMFLIAGKEANIPYSLLQNQSRELGIEKSVKFLGFQPSASEFMRTCSIGVIASIGSEEVSRACLEWMAEGRPVVGTIVGCLPELIEPEETGLLVSPGDSNLLRDALLNLLRDPAKAAEWGRNAHAHVKRLFSPEEMLRKTLEVYTAAL